MTTVIVKNNRNETLTGAITFTGAVKSNTVTLTTQSTPATPASGLLVLWYDGTHLKAIDSGAVTHTIF